MERVDKKTGRPQNRLIHIGLKMASYIVIKDMHGRLNNYSMAQIVRRCIFFVLELVDEYGSLEEVKAALEKMNRAKENGNRQVSMFNATLETFSIRQLRRYLHVTYSFIQELLKSIMLLL